MLSPDELTRLRKVHFACNDARPKCPHSQLFDTIDELQEDVKTLSLIIQNTMNQLQERQG